MGDWLSELGATIAHSNPLGVLDLMGVNSGFLSGAMNAKPDQNVLTAGISGAAGAVSGNVKDITGSVAAPVIGWASEHDPTKVLTALPMAGLHAMGIGHEGDQWDKGLIGQLGTGFDKVNRFGAFVTSFDGTSWTPDPVREKQAWNLAFGADGAAPNADHVGVGQSVVSAFTGDHESLLTNPSGLKDFEHKLNGTWWGDVATGSVDIAFNLLADPTRGAGKAAELARAGSYLADGAKAEALVSHVNDAVAAGESVGAKSTLKDVAAGAAGKGVSVESQAGRMWDAVGRTDNVTDINAVIAHLKPMLGEGATAPRQALPAIAELWADAGKVADETLQRQAKINILGSIAGSDGAKQWLAQNLPAVAAKGARVTSAPSEFTLLHDAMQDFAAKGGTKFDVGDWVERHYGSASNKAEIAAYGDKINQVQKMLDQTNGVEFGTSGLGVQVAPRALEKAKTGWALKVQREYLFQDGSLGRTARVMSAVSQDQPIAGVIQTRDATRGNAQLVGTLKEFSNKVTDVRGNPVLTGDEINSWSEAFLRADPQNRAGVIDNLNSTLLEKAAYAHGLTGEQIKQLTAESAQASRAGREYASRKAYEALANGEKNVALGDLGGGDTYLDSGFLAKHLDDSHYVYDWQTANDAVRMFKSETDLKGVAKEFNQQILLKGITRYHQLWKHAQLGRPGLAVRALLDTGLRGTTMIGSATQALQALNGAMNLAKNSRLIKTDTYRVAGASLEDSVLAGANREAAAAARGTVQDQTDAILALNAKVDKATDLTSSLWSKVDEASAAGNDDLAAIYRARAQSGYRLTQKLRKDMRSMVAERDALAADRQASASALDASASRLEAGTDNVVKNRIATTSQTHEVDGVKADFTLAHNEQDFHNTLTAAVGSGNLSSLFLQKGQSQLSRWRVDANSWSKNVAADDLAWSTKYVEATQAYRTDYTARRILSEADALNTPEALHSLLNDPKVRAEFKQVTGGGTREDMATWLDATHTAVASMAPTQEWRDLLLRNQPLTVKDVEALAPDAGSRFDIFGPEAFRETLQPKHLIDKFYHVALDLPDQYLARIPVVNGLYHKNVDKLMPSFVDTAKAEGRDHLTVDELQRIHERAKGMALNDVRRDMYDVSRFVGAHGVMSYIAPFFGPWEDAMMSWGRLMYDDPSRVGQLMRYSQTPSMLNMTVDKDGNPVKPWDGHPLSETFIQVPLAGLGGQDNFRVNMSSLNAIAQGNNPLTPGVGPMVQLAGTELVANVLPKVAPDAWAWLANNPGNPISQQLFLNGDIPKGGLKQIVATQMPSYIRSLSDVVLGENGFGNTYVNAYGTRYNDLIRQFREDNGGRDPSPVEAQRLQDQADSGAKAAAFTRAAASFGLGLSGSAATQGQYYVDQMHALVAAAPMLKQKGLTPEQVFAALYPDAAGLNWRFSDNQGRLEATVTATDSYYKNRRLMDANPDLKWFIAGPDNTAGFDPSAYNQQTTAGIRSKLSVEDLNKQADIAMGARKWDQFNRQLNLYMSQNGITSLSAKNAGQLSALKQQFQDTLRAEHKDWAEYEDTLDRGARDRMIAAATQLAVNPALRDRPDMVVARQYLAARQSLVDLAHAQGISEWQRSKGLLAQRTVLRQLGEQLAASNVVFESAWSRLFEGEFKADLATDNGGVPSGQPISA